MILVIMSLIKMPPPAFTPGKSYTRYRRELLAWKEISDETFLVYDGNITGHVLGEGTFRGSTNRATRGGFSNITGKSGHTNESGQVGKIKRKLNPKGADGKTLLCLSCGSWRHMIRDCPDSWENMAALRSVYEVNEEPVN